MLELPGGEPNLGFVRLVVEQGRQGEPFSQDELLLLNALERKHRLTVSDAAATIQKGRSGAEARLRKLCESGFVELRGTARQQVFHLSEATSLQLGDRTDAHRGGVERIQHDEMIRRYIEDHGSISRKDVVELCAISAPQAYRLLKKMELEGVLRRIGTRGRSVRYERNA